MASLIDRVQTVAPFRTAGRFLVVGMLGTLIDFTMFTGLHVGLGFSILPANILSYSAGIVNNFIWHRTWTFAGRPHRALGVQLMQFMAVSLSALAINTLLVLLLSQPAGRLLASSSAGALLAKAFATGVGLIWNYFANHLWTFRSAEKGEAE